MKLVVKTLILAVVFGTFACGDDDENTLSIVGTYTLSQESVSGCNDPADNVVENKSCTATECETLTIAPDGTYTFVEVEAGITTTETGTYSISGNQMNINSPTSTDIATFTLSGSTLTIVFPAEGDGCTETDVFTRS